MGEVSECANECETECQCAVSGPVGARVGGCSMSASRCVGVPGAGMETVSECVNARERGWGSPGGPGVTRRTGSDIAGVARGGGR